MIQDWNDPEIQSSIARDAMEAGRKIEELQAENARFRKALEQIKAVRYGLELSMSETERADYWSHLAQSYRRIAGEALKWASST